MPDLRTRYLGLDLHNPLIASASPLSKELDSARRLEDAGIAGLVMYSLFEEQIVAEERRYERFVEHGALGHAEASGFIPRQSGYESSLDKYLEQLQCLKSALAIPVIVSLNGTSEAGWIEYGDELVEAGADALELNIYYIAANPAEDCTAVERRYIDIVRRLRSNVEVPIAVKIGSQFSSPLDFVRQLQAAGADAVAVFNRFYQADIDLEQMSVAPALQLSDPYEALLRIRWTALLRETIDLDLAVTGGFHGSEQVLKAIAAGANVVQLCSVLLQQGAACVPAMLRELEQWLEQAEYDSLDQLRGCMSNANLAQERGYGRENYLAVLDSYTPPAGVRH
jgi:dihydroorotate dehydrogenase (fumarate)